MSRHDSRRALSVRLPDDLRRKLVKTSPAFLPLTYLMRHTLRRALTDGVRFDTSIEPGSTRPLLLQLPAGELTQLDAIAADNEVTQEVAILSLVAAAL